MKIIALIHAYYVSSRFRGKLDQILGIQKYNYIEFRNALEETKEISFRKAPTSAEVNRFFLPMKKLAHKAFKAINIAKYFRSKVFLLNIVLVLFTLSSWAQTKVGGIVRDVDGNPMAYTNVIFFNSSEGTITDENGKFYMESEEDYEALQISFTGYKTETFPLRSAETLDIEVTLQDNMEELGSVQIFAGKMAKKNNPAIDILRKIWKNKRKNGVHQYTQYEYDKYEKIEFDLNTIDSTMIKSRLFKEIDFIFKNIDTNAISGKNYLPIFINEAVSEVYGDNKINKEKEVLKGNQNSGFSNNHALVDFLNDLYAEYDIYDNYLRLFDKNFISPLSKTGIDVYNYVLADSSYIDNKWSYKIVYYPRRPNELTFQGDFWVNDTTWAIKDINLEMSKNANINWVNEVYIEQEFDVKNDSTFVLSRDNFMVNFALKKKEDARGVSGKRTTLYKNYVFDTERPGKFYDNKRQKLDRSVYNRSDAFWEEKRIENLSLQEQGTYAMLDSLIHTKTFKTFYDIGSIIGSGYYNHGDFDFGPIPSIVGYNEVEGLRFRAGARTYFSPDDMWRFEGFLAYGFKDHRFKYGLSGKWLLEPRSRLKIMGGYRQDVEQLGASLTTTSDVLGRSQASSSIFMVGSNKSLTTIKLANVGLEISPVENFKIWVDGSFRKLESATPDFSLDYYIDDEHTETSSKLNQVELSTTIEFTPNRKTTNYGVDRIIINKGRYSQISLTYTKGIKGPFNSDFNYDKLQFYYRQPLHLGSFGLLTPMIEVGKNFGEVPLGLLSVIPGNQSVFSVYESFPLLDYYEFVTDTYATWHLEHDFGGRLFSYVPILRKFQLREIVGIRGAYGKLSDKNRDLNASITNPFLTAP